MPTPSQQRRPQKGRAPGPLKLFLAGLAFLAVMGFAAIETLWRTDKRG